MNQKSEISKKQISEKYNEYLTYIGEVENKKQMMFAEIREMRLEYVKKTYNISIREMFLIDNKRYAIEFFHIYENLSPDHIFFQAVAGILKM